jgi:hypothetical protein
MMTLPMPLDLVLDGHLEDFRGGIDVLRNSKSGSEQHEAAKILCELSRDICFRMGPADRFIGRGFVEEVAHLFEQAADLVQPNGDKQVEGFCAHIRKRAATLKSELTRQPK